jgi:hypothetical protein
MESRQVIYNHKRRKKNITTQTKVNFPKIEILMSPP